jgi:hypothetical protein
VENAPHKANRQADGPGGKESWKPKTDRRAVADIPHVSGKAPGAELFGVDWAVSDETPATGDDRLATEQVEMDAGSRGKSADEIDGPVTEQHRSGASDGVTATESDALPLDQGSFDSTILNKGGCGIGVCILYRSVKVTFGGAQSHWMPTRKSPA